MTPKALAANRANWQKAVAVMASRPKRRVTAICQLCGKAVEVEPYRVKRFKFCGLVCKQRAAGLVRGAQIAATRGTGWVSKYVKRNGRHEHRIVAEQMLGRPLRRGEIVHHKDGDGHNNDPANLQVMYQPDHVRQHYEAMMLRRLEVAGY